MVYSWWARAYETRERVVGSARGLMDEGGKHQKLFVRSVKRRRRRISRRRGIGGRNGGRRDKEMKEREKRWGKKARGNKRKIMYIENSSGNRATLQLSWPPSLFATTKRSSHARCSLYIHRHIYFSFPSFNGNRKTSTRTASPDHSSYCN